MSNLQIVAVADGEPSQPYLVRGFGAFKDSCRKYGHEPIILGWGDRWRGLGSKPKLLKRAIEDHTITAPYILFMDAYDTCLAQPPEYILRAFQDKMIDGADQAQILWNGERNCFPRQEWASHHPETPFPYRYFNSGMSIGATEAYHAMLSQIGLDQRPDDHQKPDGSWHHENDQDYLMDKFLHGQCSADEPVMAIDSKADVFQTLVGETMDTFELLPHKGIRNRLTGTYPAAWHWNGSAKTNGTMEPILQHLRL